MPNFVSVATSVVELAHGEKSRTRLLNLSSSLFDATGTEAFASEKPILFDLSVTDNATNIYNALFAHKIKTETDYCKFYPNPEIRRQLSVRFVGEVGGV